MVWSLSQEPRIRIGEREGDARYLFQQVSGVRILPDGGLAVADRGFSSIRVFGPDGLFRVEMGRAGEGPGEFRWLGYIELLPPDTILAYDGAAYRVSTFLSDGRLVGTRSIQAEDGGPEVYLGTYSNGDAAIAWIGSAARDPTVASPDPMRMGRFGRDGALVVALGTGNGMRRLGRSPIPFSPYLHAFLLRDSVFYTDGIEPSINVLDGDGAMARTVPGPLPALDPRQAWATLRSELEARDQVEALDAIPEAARAEPIPRIAEVLLDDAGRFWVKGYQPRTDSHMLGGWAGARGGHWVVVEADGTIVAEIDLPEGFIAMDVRGGRIAGLVRDGLGVERVRVYDFG